MLLNLINFGSLCWIYINWVLANLGNFDSIWVILGQFSWIQIILLSFDQLGSCNYNKLCYILVTGLSLFCLFWITLLNTGAFYSIYIKWLLAILLNLINFGSFCWIYINWVLANLDNFGSIWVIFGHLSWIRIILLNFDQLGSCNYNKLCYILVTGFSLFWLTGFILTHLANFQLFWPILVHFKLFRVILIYFHSFLWFILLHLIQFSD